MSFWNFGAPTDPPAEPTAPSDSSAAPPVEGSDPPELSAAPQYATVDQINQLSSTMNELAQYMKQAMTPPEPEPQEYVEPTPAAPSRTVTVEQINQAYAEGDYAKGAQLMTKYNSEEVSSKLFEFEQTRFNPVVQSASRTMSSMSEHAAQALPYFKRYEKEIRAAVREMGPKAASNPQSWKIAHDYVKGIHADELIAEALETSSRKTAQEPGGSPLPKAGKPEGAGPLDVKTAYGDEYASLKQMASMRGYTPEQLVQLQYTKSHFKGSFQDYLKAQRAAYEESHV